MNITKGGLEKIPNRTNHRNYEQIISKFPGFEKYIIDYIDRKIADNTPLGVIEIGPGQGIVLEAIKEKSPELIQAYGLAKYPEREQNPNYPCIKNSYYEYEIIDKLPDSLENNSVDIIFSFHTVQYIEKPFHILQSIHKKLKPGGRAYINIGSIINIHPNLIKEFIEINGTLGTQIYIDNINANGQYVIYIEKKYLNTLQIPDYKYTKTATFTAEQIIKSIQPYVKDKEIEHIIKKSFLQNIKHPILNTLVYAHY